MAAKIRSHQLNLSAFFSLVDACVNIKNKDFGKDVVRLAAVFGNDRPILDILIKQKGNMNHIARMYHSSTHLYISLPLHISCT